MEVKDLKHVTIDEIAKLRNSSIEITSEEKKQIARSKASPLRNIMLLIFTILAHINHIMK